MADQTVSSISVLAPPEKVMAVIADFSAYPQWATGVQRADIAETGPDGRALLVRFVLDAAPIRDEYTLRYQWDGHRSVRWTLVEGRVLKALEGAYELRPRGEQTDVTYRLAVDVAIPMIGLLKRKAEKVVIDTALKGLKQRVEDSG